MHEIVCIACGKRKEASAYPADATLTSGHRRRCTQCETMRKAQWAKANGTRCACGKRMSHGSKQCEGCREKARAAKRLAKERAWLIEHAQRQQERTDAVVRKERLLTIRRAYQLRKSHWLPTPCPRCGKGMKPGSMRCAVCARISSELYTCV
ncbi:hypothetical protein [Phyllobacterium pellucidum]|uniref:hypothetical protein n=1 Tax=Phyllobacterium pellucidum TaxID=2740464 RepID=UPI001D144147|nr:hypothetical protein [Phyllobacterium sp. T1018]UGY08650.1 hypothetical protein LLE51_011435 [Phyllobacterium sp. T1018]